MMIITMIMIVIVINWYCKVPKPTSPTGLKEVHKFKRRSQSYKGGMRVIGDNPNV